MASPEESTDARLFPLTSRPGIKRDGTIFDGNYWVDGQHVRFHRGRPRKMGGHRMMSPYFDGPIRKMWLDDNETSNRLWGGSAGALQFCDVSADGIGSSIVDVTPTIADGFIPSDLNTWQFAQLFDATSNTGRIIAHAAPNIANIGSSQMRKIWFGDANGSARLVDTTGPQVSGGILAAAPYVIAYGSDGYVGWCVPNLPDDWIGSGSGEARVTEHKIVYGKKIRGGSGQSPAFLLWSLNAVLRTTFSGGVNTFNFDTIAEDTSILSSSAVVEYDGLIFWPAVDRFMVYNGVVDELQNDMNSDYFFENLNWAHRQKVWATKVPRYGEIWFFYPRGTATECNAAVIYNKRLNTWYDTMIDRSAGVAPQVFRYPVWADTIRSETTFIRPLGGTPTTDASGNADNAFDDNPATDCAHVNPDGAIGYDWGLDAKKKIKKVGIMPAVDATYDLVFEVSQDTVTWQSFLEIGSAAYTTGDIVVFELQNEIEGRAMRVREQGGAILDLAEVYFYAYGTMIHQHEFGYDKLIGNMPLSIKSYIESGNVAYSTTGPLGDRWLGVDVGVELQRLEPDLLQVGNMTVTVIGRPYAKDEDDPVSFIMTPEAPYLDRKTQRRNMRIRFQSDAVNGFFELGEVKLKLKPGDSNFG
jgi:hypothetical protein